ncbi:MAG TPA: 30S ribosomal protein S5 [Phycisphaerae bacterium]|nr:30S ribosomal protein S5 [Phycisphaerae bacterium]HOI54052.1 30S ribosomal protein S5 [Phycisphaerae bacterium]
MAKETYFADAPSFEETVVRINRCATVVKGGRRFSFSALVVVGDRRGRVGIGYGKANGVLQAIEKGTKDAHKNLVNVRLKGDTIPHAVMGRHGAAQVFLRPAGPGTGVIAGAAVRAVLEAAGVHNILSKSYRSNNPVNLTKAALDGLLQLRLQEDIEQLRDIKIETVAAGSTQASE